MQIPHIASQPPPPPGQVQRYEAETKGGVKPEASPHCCRSPGVGLRPPERQLSKSSGGGGGVGETGVRVRKSGRRAAPAEWEGDLGFVLRER